MDFYRPRLDDDVLRFVDLEEVPHGRWVRTAGLVICRQAPPTAKGHVFLTMEDETGLLSVTIRPNVYQAFRRIVRHALVMLVEGPVQRQEGTLSVLARRFQPLSVELALPSAREFR
jgi:error-prone DNA polymerase